MILVRLITFGVFLAAVNVIAIAIVGEYHLALGSFRLNATSLFKPLLYLNGAILAYLAVAGGQQGSAEPSGLTSTAKAWSPYYIAVALLVTLAVYGMSFGINLDYFDWTHRVTTEGRSPVSFFTDGQYDGFYRPIAMLSLWIDSTLFGSRLWIYHVQNLILCALNGILVLRLARRFGLSETWARWAGLLFLVVPAGFEAIIWPGARFDLLATTFLLLALERALAGAIFGSGIYFVLGVLSKESVYCFPLVVLFLWCFHSRVVPHLDRRLLRKAFVVSVLLTIAMIAIRFAVYDGSFGGYPDQQTGRTVHFAFTARTVTSFFTRPPAAVFLMNTTMPADWWMRLAVCGYAVFAILLAYFRAGLGRRWPLVLLPFLSVLPALNMIAWLNASAQQGRYVYQSAIWVVIAICCSLSMVRRGSWLAGLLAVCFAATSFFNSLAYVRMLAEVQAVAEDAVLRCGSAQCCRTVILENFPTYLYGAFYFEAQVESEIKRRLPRAEVLVSEKPSPPRPCGVVIRWSSPALPL